MESPAGMLDVLESPLLVPLLIAASPHFNELLHKPFVMLSFFFFFFNFRIMYCFIHRHLMLLVRQQSSCGGADSAVLFLCPGPNLLLSKVQMFVLQGSALSRCERVCNWFSCSCLRTCLVTE